MYKFVNNMKKYLAPEVQIVACVAMADMLTVSGTPSVTPTNIPTHDNPLQKPIKII